LGSFVDILPEVFAELKSGVSRRDRICGRLRRFGHSSGLGGYFAVLSAQWPVTIQGTRCRQACFWNRDAWGLLFVAAEQTNRPACRACLAIEMSWRHGLIGQEGNLLPALNL
jgi:hypothetical protein